MTARQTRINLLKWLEQSVHIFGLDADTTIAHTRLQPAISDLTFDPHLTTLSEFYSVIDQVDEHLFHAPPVIINCIYTRSDGRYQL